MSVAGRWSQTVRRRQSTANDPARESGHPVRPQRNNPTGIMTETTTYPITLDLIDVPHDRARELDPAWAEALAAIIAEQGLLQPIVLRAAGDRFRLVAGLHRLEALRLLQRTTAPAIIAAVETDDEARLMEVMENLGRYELIALDRCRHLWELKQVWERMYPETKNGGDRGNQHTGGRRQSLPSASEGAEIFGFAKSTAEKIGLSERAIRLAVRIWDGLHAPLRPRLVGTDLATKQTELKALSELPRPMQVKVLDLILGDAPVENVAQALDYLNTGVKPDAHERRWIALRETIQKLSEEEFDRLVIAQEERVIASLRRRGRI